VVEPGTSSLISIELALMLLLLIPSVLPMQNQHLAIKLKMLWNITTLKISQFYDGACEETPRKHSQAGESRAGCPNLFY
jgi:hypothetical protein